MKFKLYDAILNGYEDVDPLDYARGMVWDEMEYEIVDHLPYYHQYKYHINELDIYYDYGADYYYFVEEVEEAGDLRAFVSA